MQTSSFKLTEHIVAEHSSNHLHLSLRIPHQVISSAVLNGGLCKADHIVNMHVPEINCEDITEPPATTVTRYCSTNAWHGTNVGMMTSASMESFRMTEDTTQGVKTVVLLTSGLDNLRRAGDIAEHRNISSSTHETGTINIILLTTARLLPKAMIECVQMVTEAKVACLDKLHIKSPLSGLTATGTGTDAVAIINGQGEEIIEYCGKHTLFGEILANLVMDALEQSLKLKWTNAIRPNHQTCSIY